MSLTSYTADAREDISDVEHLRAVLDELQLVLADLETRLAALESA
jgi:hypothetical protein